MENEEWRDVVDYEGLYQVSNLGRVKHLATYMVDTRGREWRRPERFIKAILNYNGYWRVGLSKNGKFKRHYLHRLIAEAFIPNPNNLPCIDHINTNRKDNRIENLQWVTCKENLNNPLSKINNAVGVESYLKEHRRGNSPFAIKIVGINLSTGEITKYDCIRDASEHGFCESYIAKCIREIKGTHRGYKWLTQDEYNQIK